ncbi:EcsC family protein [Lichenihabitans sp. Uapishka_5]|uniref:EcsC family protein n=1 Tax=Lichenihabitans sp. Uapishka_5 TaxID=3037302 RepID=UPI0029E81165|nr:EcsC family protein [Lichenihabitans sp. Uapishka_5]MDX7952280.1 EcsC family protein [Lichenihabitans sp. Uapishka_5]
MTTDVLAPATDLVFAGSLSPEDRDILRNAMRTLEHPSLPARLGALLGQQIGLAGRFVPDAVVSAANSAANVALRTALRAAIKTLPKTASTKTSRWHTALAAMSGAAGGLFGLAALPVELPVSTTIILRSIAGIARQEGEDPHDPGTALACLEVFALGGGQEAGPAGEGGYLAVRAALAKSIQQATRVVLQRGLADETAPTLVRFIGQIVSRFSVTVSQKAAAQAVPVIGAAAGAAINAAFAEHYQALARAHFQVRRLERLYGAEMVREEYRRLISVETAPHAA